MNTKYDKYPEGFSFGLFSNEFAVHPVEVSNHVKEDHTNSYSLNSLGYRSGEFSESTELLSAGCSFTFGSGVAQKHRWSSVLAESLQLSESNIGVCAWSTQAIIQNIFAYFKKYGHPKVLVCLFPDDTRSVIPSVRGFFEYEDASGESDFEISNAMLDRTNSDYMYKTKSSYSKKPYNPESVVPLELPFYYYLKYIHFLESYCKVAGVKFLWSTWDSELETYLSRESADQVQENHKYFGFTDYVPLRSSSWGWDVSSFGGGMTSGSLSESKRVYSGCHSELLARDNDNFYIGTDIGGLVHWGTHKHMHIAEAFLSALKEG